MARWDGDKNRRVCNGKGKGRSRRTTPLMGHGAEMCVSFPSTGWDILLELTSLSVRCVPPDLGDRGQLFVGYMYSPSPQRSSLGKGPGVMGDLEILPGKGTLYGSKSVVFKRQPQYFTLISPTDPLSYSVEEKEGRERERERGRERRKEQTHPCGHPLPNATLPLLI